jgi:hypothetical protein
MRIEMSIRQFIRSPRVLLFCLVLFPVVVFGQSGPARATKFRLEPVEGVPLANSLYVTVGGRERKISSRALQAWIIADGKSVAYSWTDGAGGFENEGQSLRIYDVRTGTTRKILVEYVEIAALTPVRLTTGELALLLKMADGGLGGSYFAVVDPKRGEVFYRRWAEVTELTGDQITLAFYNAEDWNEINEARSSEQDDPNTVISTTKVKPIKVEHHDLKRVMTMPVLAKKQPR